MIESILSWLLKAILEVLFKKAVAAAEDAKARADLAKQRGETDAENIKRYNEATTRASEIEAATDLLNGTRT